MRIVKIAPVTRLETLWIGLAVGGLGICIILGQLGAALVVAVILLVLWSLVAIWQGHQRGESA